MKERRHRGLDQQRTRRLNVDVGRKLFEQHGSRGRLIQRGVEQCKEQRWMTAADDAGFNAGDEELSNGLIGRAQQSFGHEHSALRRLRAMPDDKVPDIRMLSIESADRHDDVAQPIADRAAGLGRDRANAGHGWDRNRHDLRQTGLPQRRLVAEMNANQVGADLGRGGHAAQVGAIEAVAGERAGGGGQQRLPAVRHVLAPAALRSGGWCLLPFGRGDHCLPPYRDWQEVLFARKAADIRPLDGHLGRRR